MLCDCPHRTESLCELATAIAGQPVAVAEDACTACCTLAVRPTLESPGFVVASLAAACARESGNESTVERLSLHLKRSEPPPKGTQQPPTIATAADLAERLPVPEDRHGPPVTSWAVGVTTAPRKIPTLDKCLASMRVAGWSRPHIFAEPGSPVPDEGADVVRRPSLFGAWRNFYEGLEALRRDAPTASAYLMVQDDAFFGAQGMREHLERSLWLAEPTIGAVSLYTPSHYTPAQDGWHVYAERWKWGACAFLFPATTIDRMLDWLGRHWKPKRNKMIDIGVGRAADALKLSIWHPSPSLVQHIGTTSTLYGPGNRASGKRAASHFVGNRCRPKRSVCEFLGKTVRHAARECDRLFQCEHEEAAKVNGGQVSRRTCEKCKFWTSESAQTDDGPASLSLPPPTRFSLAYHIAPFAKGRGTLWRKNVAQLLRRIELFNGKRVIAVVHGDGLESVETVQSAFAGHRVDEWVIRANDRQTREMATFPTLLERMESTDEADAFFYAHAKGVRHWPDKVAHWRNTMYHVCLDDLPKVAAALTTHVCAGPFKHKGTCKSPDGTRTGPWHYSGTFYWVRSARLFSRPDWRTMHPTAWWSEQYLGVLIPSEQAACLYGEWTGCKARFLPLMKIED